MTRKLKLGVRSFLVSATLILLAGISPAGDVKIFESGSKRFHLTVICGDAEDCAKIKFEKLHVDDPNAPVNKLTLSGKAPVEGILVTRDEHLRVPDNQNFELNFDYDGTDQEVPLYLVEKDGSVFNFVINVKANGAATVTNETSEELPASKVSRSAPPKKQHSAEDASTPDNPIKKETVQKSDTGLYPEQTPNAVTPIAANKPLAPLRPRPRARVYRSRPFEAELRLAGEAYNSSVVLVGGASVAGWFMAEKQFLLKTPRFGFDADFEQNITNIQDQSGNNVSYTRAGAELKYNFSGKGSNRDTLFGLTAAYELFNFGPQGTNAVGVGGFWYYPIYSSADSGLNYLKWFRHPKWLDVQGQYLIAAIDSTKLAGPTLNFSGRMKIYFKPNFYYDFGVSFSTADYKISSGSEITASILTGTVGLGANF